MKGSKHFVLLAALGVSFMTFATLSSAEIIKTDAGLAGQKFCWSQGFDTEIYGRDHTYVHTYRPSFQQYDKLLSEKGTWAISKDGTITLKLDTGTQTRRYDINGGQINELTNSLQRVHGEPGKRC
jgi:hypothetical protein